MILNSKNTDSSFCELCEQVTNDNYIGGIWICGKCYPKFKKVFEHYIVFVDMDKLHELIRKKEIEMYAE